MRLIYVFAVLVVVGFCAEGQPADTGKVQLQKGSLMLQIKTSDEPVVKHRIDINSKSKAEIRLTQSSKVDIDAEIEFSKSGFNPQFFAFRLVHDQYPNLTEPVLADLTDGVFKATLDIGNPHFIQPFSDTYGLEVLVGDDNLQSNFRNVVARFNIRFAKSLSEPHKSQFHYEAKRQILFKLANDRVDPPAIFTLFATALVLSSLVLFGYSLLNLKVNFNSFPFNDPNGMVLNTGFLLAIFGLFYILVQFWVSWTFLETVRVLALFIVPTVFIGNYALLRLKH